jgi:putative iron-only hydrogenase system regulator
METRVAIISIILEDTDNTEQLNTILHEYGSYILGRMGLPYRKRGINIICVALDAPQDTINSIAGRIGRIKGINTKTVYSNTTFPSD